MRKSAIAAGVAVAVLATGLYEITTRSSASARPVVALTPELSKDLDLASAAGVEYAPMLQTVSAVERSPKGKSNGTAAPRRPRPKADPAPRKVEVGEEAGEAMAAAAEEIETTQVAEGTAEPEPEPVEEPAPVITQRPVPIPVSYPGSGGNGSTGGGGYGDGGWGGTGRGGRGGGIGGVLIGVVIRGGAVGDDHCVPRNRRRNPGSIARNPVPTTIPTSTEGVRGRGTFLR